MTYTTYSHIVKLQITSLHFITEHLVEQSVLMYSEVVFPSSYWTLFWHLLYYVAFDFVNMILINIYTCKQNKRGSHSKQNK